MEDRVRCPLIDDMIEAGDCVVYSDVANEMLKDSCIPEAFKVKEDWREICKNCKYFGL